MYIVELFLSFKSRHEIKAVLYMIIIFDAVVMEVKRPPTETCMFISWNGIHYSDVNMIFFFHYILLLYTFYFYDRTPLSLM